MVSSLFLDKNCAYRLGELLELVMNKNLVHNGLPWYFPVELFINLKDTHFIELAYSLRSCRREKGKV